MSLGDWLVLAAWIAGALFVAVVWGRWRRQVIAQNRQLIDEVDAIKDLLTGQQDLLRGRDPDDPGAATGPAEPVNPE